MKPVTIKCMAGYIGSAKVFKFLLTHNLLDFTPETRMRFKHINRHRYMDGLKREAVS